LQQAKTCSYLNDLELDISLYNRLANKNVYTTQNKCTEACKSGTVPSIASTSNSNVKISQTEIDKLIKNPLTLDCEILPLEIVKHDPVKINIVNMPKWIRDELDTSQPTKTPNYT
jgi:hypothetical protein